MRKLLSRLRPAEGSLFDVIGLGECSLDEVWRLPDGGRFRDLSGGKLSARSRDVLGGGQVATAMVACRRLGLRAAFFGLVGGDEAGRQVLHGLRDEGVSTEQARVVPDARTRCALILVDGQGERSVVELRDPRLAFRDGEPDAREIAPARVLHLDATHLPAAVLAALHARHHHTLVSIDLDHNEKGVELLVSLADLCIVSADFPREFTGESDFDSAVVALSRRTEGLVVVTLGAEGCVAVDRESGALLYCPAFPVKKAVDTTACGDTFHAAMIAFLLDGAERAKEPLQEALRFANAAAALKCRALGRRGCPTRIEVDALLKGG